VRGKLVGAGLFLLVVAAYLDNVRGTLLPAVAQSLGLTYRMASGFLAAGNVAAVLATLGLFVLSRRVSDRRVVVLISVLVALCAGLSGLATGATSLMALGALVGGTIALCGAMSNILVIHGTDPTRRARFLCALHTMYGLGSLAAPLAAAALIGHYGRWQAPLWPAIASALVLAMAAAWLPPGGPSASDRGPVRGGATPAVLVTFAFYVAAETMISAWMVTDLVGSRGFSLPEAARVLSAFFFVMGATRALCFLSLPEARERAVMAGSLIAGLTCFTVGQLAWPPLLAGAGLVGPFFPILLARASRAHPEQSRAITLQILTVAQLSVGVAHLGVGALTDAFGISAAYWAAAGFMLIALGMTFFGRLSRP